MESAMPSKPVAPNPEDLVVVDDGRWQAVRGRFHGILSELYGAERRPEPKVEQPFTLPMSEATFATLGLAQQSLVMGWVQNAPALTEADLLAYLRFV
jgi:hypothetical protein